MLYYWARKEQDLGGRIFTRENRLESQSTWGWSPLWENCLLVKYEFGRIPYGPAMVFDKKLGIPIGMEEVREGQLVRIWPTRLVRGNNTGNVVIRLTIKHAYRRKWPEKDVPRLCAKYVNDVLLHYDVSDGCYKLVRVSTNGEMFERAALEDSNSGNYFMSLLETVGNELIYLDREVQNMPDREQYQINPKKFYSSKYRYKHFEFFLSNLDWPILYDKEEKEISEKKNRPIVEIKTTTYETTGKHAGTINQYTSASPSTEYIKLFGKLEVSGIILSENITSKSNELMKNPPLATALDTETGWVLVYWPGQYYHAFWVFRMDDYDWFVKDGVLDRTLADDAHPFFRFLHTKPSFKKLMKLVYNKDVVFDD